MSTLSALYRFRFRALANQATQQLDTNKLKFIIVSSSALVLWASIFVFFHNSLRFVHAFEEIGDVIRLYFLALFFFTLGVMLVISNIIINYSSLFHSPESDYLISLPVSASRIFFYKLTESVAFSSWAFLFLGSPLLISFGLDQRANWLYYGWAALFSAVFIALPALLGSILSLIIGRFLPRHKRAILLALLGLLAVAVAFFITQMADLRGTRFEFTAGWMQKFMGRLSFAQNPLLPSFWVTRGLFSAAETAGARDTIFFFLLLLSQVLFLGLLVHWLASAFYFTGYSLVRSSRHDKKYKPVSLVDRAIHPALWFLDRPLRLIIIKDIKTLMRDPVQWTQFLIFFGLLAIYFINIKNIPYINLQEHMWQYLVSSLNLIATTLTLATFTTRFIYPQISLEGKRFWIIGMMPLKREDIFYSKLVFALCGAILITLPLVFISSYQLEVPSFMLMHHLYVAFLICLGLSSIAVTLGVLYPNMREDNPSKIVSGFGGTLTLVLSLLYVLSIIVIGSLPSHLYYVLRRINIDAFMQFQTISIIIISAIAISTTGFSVWLGLRTIRKIEV
jgi:ABC-2 type transport system permease protein